jgi:hypothetical protein
MNINFVGFTVSGFAVLLLLLQVFDVTNAFNTLHYSRSCTRPQSPTCLNACDISRSKFIKDVFGLGVATAVTAAILPSPAFAAGSDSNTKGTKKDPEFEACLSQCMYDCTKPKGIEQKSRAVCLPECKQQCAKTKAQLLHLKNENNIMRQI